MGSRLSLAVLFGAAVSPIYCARARRLGIEQVRIVRATLRLLHSILSYPYSHSLLTLLIWGAILGWLAMRMVGDARAFIIVLALVASQWVLDFITHCTDMPLYPGGPKFGLGCGTPSLERWRSKPRCSRRCVWIYTRVDAPARSSGRWDIRCDHRVSGFGFLRMWVLRRRLQSPPCGWWRWRSVLSHLALAWGGRASNFADRERAEG